MIPSRVILIAGPTASGKSALAIELASRERGIVVNADAMQVYEGLPVLSAQPQKIDQRGIPHKLYGSFDPSTPSSVARWLKESLREIREAHCAGYVPVLVGGTGLYFNALTLGLSDIPDVPESVRTQARDLYDKLGDLHFRAELSALDPESAAKLARNDSQRLVRAYEVAKHTGKPIGYWQKQRKALDCANFVFERHLLMPARDQLYSACDRRFVRMMEQGAIEEAKQFLSRGLDPSLSSMKTIGIRELGAFLRGDISRDEAVAQAQQATRNYAKRQMTWFRNQWPCTAA